MAARDFCAPRDEPDLGAAAPDPASDVVVDGGDVTDAEAETETAEPSVDAVDFALDFDGFFSGLATRTAGVSLAAAACVAGCDCVGWSFVSTATEIGAASANEGGATETAATLASSSDWRVLSVSLSGCVCAGVCAAAFAFALDFGLPFGLARGVAAVSASGADTEAVLLSVG